MTKNYIIRIAKEVGLPKWYQDNALANESLIVKFAALIAAAEREACAEVAAWILKMPENDVSVAIRARREQ